MSDELNQQQREMNAAEISQQRKNIVEHYKQNISVLKLQAEQEALIANIAESRVKALIMETRYAEMTAPKQAEPKAETKMPAPEPADETTKY